MKDQVQDGLSHEIPPVENATTIEVILEPGLEKEVAAMGPLVNKRLRKKGNDEAEANAPPKVLRKDHAAFRPAQSTVGGKSLDPMGSAVLCETATAPRARHYPIFQENCHRDPHRKCFYHIGRQEVAMGSQLRLRFEQKVRLLKKAIANIAKQDQRIQAREEEMKKLDQEIKSLRAVEAELRVDFEELYLHMLTAIAGRRWIIGHGLRLAVMKCDESPELRQSFADVVSTGLVKGMSEGLKHGIKHGKADRDLAVVEAYDLEADSKYVKALQDLKDQKYLSVDQLERLKDALMELIMTSLHLESDSEEDSP
uniref:Transposase (Putative), gypsy type n=1 Tax=Tanacetum cinerariifolium TaxID=118510 RepID=A0A699HYB1_TANCI|nr:hypothetical protein [Tanacetum cinerariifolium]